MDVEFDQTGDAGQTVADDDGFRPNVGIVLSNSDKKVLWARRARHDGWQFPQGGIEPNENLLDAVYRELYEEIGLGRTSVELLGRTRTWLRYRLPSTTNRYENKTPIKGQKQIWFLFRLTGHESDIDLRRSVTPEFDHWRWVSFWFPVEAIVEFKRQVYRAALRELRPILDRQH